MIDGAIAAQNMILAAQDLGIGSVWLGTWPQMDRVKRQQELFDIPDRYFPHSIIAFGYPAESTFEERNQLEPDNPGTDCHSEWCEPVGDAWYDQLEEEV